LIFHSLLNTLGEMLQFADREFYHDWWNANNILIFWKTWNLPVHRYIPAIISAFLLLEAAFFLSGCLLSHGNMTFLAVVALF